MSPRRRTRNKKEKGAAVKRLQPRLFRRRLITGLVPVFIAIISLGILSFFITMNFLKSDIELRNATLLKQDIQRIETMNDDIETININFGINSDITVNLKRIMNSSELTLEDIRQVNTLESLLSAPAYSKQDIQSIYVYFNNSLRRFISTTDNLTTLDGQTGSEPTDRSWYDSYLKNRNTSQIWYETRRVQIYSFDTPTALLTIYKNIYQSGFSSSTGVIVLNIRLDYITRLLQSMCTSPGQRILLLNQKGNLICESDGANFKAASYQHLPAAQRSVIRVINSQPCVVSQASSTKYGMKMVSAIPVRQFYKVPIRLLELTALLLLLTMAMGIFFSYRSARYDYRRIHSIIQIIDNAGSGEPTDPLEPNENDEYSYIINNIVKTFVEKDFLKVQLSEKMYKEKALELMALQSQINPHFMFNTLETIYLKTLGLTGGHNEVSTMLENLSTILQYSLGRSNENISIQDEIQNAQSYVAIQKIRYRNMFELKWDIAGDMSRYAIIKLVLQPLIENAISYTAKEKAVQIKVKIRVRGDVIQLAVIDNGIGISPEKLMQITHRLSSGADDIGSGRHIGLYNTHKRLRLAYGDRYGLHIRSKFGFGTAVYLRIPKIHIPDPPNPLKHLPGGAAANSPG